MRRALALAALVAMAGCREEPLEPLGAEETAELQARTYNFQVYPGARFLEAQTDVLRRAHFVMLPDAVEAPPMAMYETEAPVDEVARWYASAYGYSEVAEDDVNEFSSVRPPAYFTSGDLAADAAAILPILEKLGLELSVDRISGTWNGAHIAPREEFPRVTLQRPYVDFVNDRPVDRTLILMVRE
ncbi:MAG TPA: hypothetical protein VMS56_02435 [Thermoanaerobaculia bacterium]|nr:hypothetical protein [Thermoanaerobaculia bacterium]